MENTKKNEAAKYSLNGQEPVCFVQWLTGLLQPDRSDEEADEEIFLNFSEVAYDV